VTIDIGAGKEWVLQSRVKFAKQFWGQLLNFWAVASSQQPKMKNKLFFYLFNKKQNSFHPAKQSVQNPVSLLIIGWGEQF